MKESEQVLVQDPKQNQERRKRLGKSRVGKRRNSKDRAGIGSSQSRTRYPVQGALSWNPHPLEGLGYTERPWIFFE